MLTATATDLNGAAAAHCRRCGRRCAGLCGGHAGAAACAAAPRPYSPSTVLNGGYRKVLSYVSRSSMKWGQLHRCCCRSAPPLAMCSLLGMRASPIVLLTRGGLDRPSHAPSSPPSAKPAAAPAAQLACTCSSAPLRRSANSREHQALGFRNSDSRHQRRHRSSPATPPHHGEHS